MISSDQIAKNYDIAGVRKANLPGLHMLLLGFFAGMFIALAGAAASVASADITNPSTARIVSALVFPAGLAMVICNGSELFTGNCLMVISLLDHKITFKALMKNYLFVYLGNLIGSLFVSVLFVYGHIPGLYDGLLAQNMVNTAVTKVSLSFSEVFFRGILCNVMVCVAVWMGMSATHSFRQNSRRIPSDLRIRSLRLRTLCCKHVLHSRRYDDRICIRHRCRGLKYRNLYPQQSDALPPSAISSAVSSLSASCTGICSFARKTKLSFSEQFS